MADPESGTTLLRPQAFGASDSGSCAIHSPPPSAAQSSSAQGCFRYGLHKLIFVAASIGSQGSRSGMNVAASGCPSDPDSNPTAASTRLYWLDHPPNSIVPAGGHVGIRPTRVSEGRVEPAR